MNSWSLQRRKCQQHFLQWISVSHSTAIAEWVLLANRNLRFGESQTWTFFPLGVPCLSLSDLLVDCVSWEPWPKHYPWAPLSAQHADAWADAETLRACLLWSTVVIKHWRNLLSTPVKSQALIWFWWAPACGHLETRALAGYSVTSGYRVW